MANTVNNPEENIRIRSPKAKLYESPPKFNNEEDITILETFEGNKIKNGKHANKIKNSYRLVKINYTNETYYEMFLGIDNSNEENETNDNSDTQEETQYSFIFDIGSLNKILKLTLPNKIIERPVWHLASNHYIWCRPPKHKTIYLHRYLMNMRNGDNQTIDHINGNKLDNRLSNLRIATMSEQNVNRPNVKRKQTITQILQQSNIDSNTNTTITTNTTSESIPEQVSLNIDSFLFISKNTNYFTIEVSAVRTGDVAVREKSSKSAKLTLEEKLCHALVKRYFIIKKYPNIMQNLIDNKKFESIEELESYSGDTISKILKINYTITTFIDYLKSKNIAKFIR